MLTDCLSYLFGILIISWLFRSWLLADCFVYYYEWFTWISVLSWMVIISNRWLLADCYHECFISVLSWICFIISYCFNYCFISYCFSCCLSYCFSYCLALLVFFGCCQFVWHYILCFIPLCLLSVVCPIHSLVIARWPT